MEKLFVYGSMSEGMVHYGRIGNFIESQTKAKTEGQVFKLQVGYPVFSDEGSDTIYGQVVELQDKDTLWVLLDELHGVHPTQPEKGLHFRKRIQVRDELGVNHEAYVYVVNKAKLPKQAVLIDGGNWQEDLQQSPPLTAQLNDQQVSYLKKLGQSSGRDIIPINLQLYRELMKLEMIVDKGRRLALSRLGKEVYRYL